MPVNSSSTGASYGKSSDPLCPLGFHPQVRWPTRCKRCFRDYKEHLDDRDRAKFANTDSDNNQQDIQWSQKNGGRRAGFNKSKSLDVEAARGTSSEAAAETGKAAFGRFFEPPKARVPLPNEFQGVAKVNCI